jgi:hypothetical protein
VGYSYSSFGGNIINRLNSPDSVTTSVSGVPPSLLLHPESDSNNDESVVAWQSLACDSRAIEFLNAKSSASATACSHGGSAVSSHAPAPSPKKEGMLESWF